MRKRSALFIFLALLPIKAQAKLWVASTGTHNTNCSALQPCNASTQAAKVARDNYPTHNSIGWFHGDYRSTNPTTAFSNPKFVAGDLPVNASSWFYLEGEILCDMFSTTCAPIFNGYEIAFDFTGGSWTIWQDMFSQNTQDKALGWKDVTYSHAKRIGAKNCNTWANNFGTCFEFTTADDGGNINSNGLLAEDLWGVGVFKYGLMFGGDNAYTEASIARRVVLRWDGSAPTGNPTGGIVNYGATTGVLGARNNLIQNGLVFDFNSCVQPWYEGGDTCYGGYYNPHAAVDIIVKDSFAIKLGTHTDWKGYMMGEENSQRNALLNSVLWAIPGNIISMNGTVDPTSMTIRGNTLGGQSGEPFFDDTSVVLTINNQWFHTNTTICGSTCTNNGYFPSTSSAGGAKAYLDDPQLVYVTSPSVVMSTRGFNAPLGATIKFQRGINGSWWGQPGYDTVTSTPLFNPDWPYANRIRSMFCAPDEPGSDAAINNPQNDESRGWCGTNLMLSAYVATIATADKTCPSDLCIEASEQGGGDPAPAAATTQQGVTGGGAWTGGGKVY